MQLKKGKDYEKFRDMLGLHESSNNYNCVNKYGYMGRYQFGRSRLWDLGISLGGWIPAGRVKTSGIRTMTVASFLADRATQDLLFDRHVMQLAGRVVQSDEYQSAKESGLQYSLSGIVAGCHLLGFGGFVSFVHGFDHESDADGMTFKRYATIFNNLNIVELA